MRKLLLVMSALAITIVAIDDSHAFDVKNKFMMSVGGGVAIPLGDFADGAAYNPDAGGAKTGYDLGMALEYGVTANFLVGGRFACSRFNNVSSTLLLGHPGAQADWTVLEIFGLYAKYFVLPSTARTRPFGRAGLFLGKPDLKFTGADSPWSGEYDVSLGLEAAIGVTHMISPRFGIGLEARFAHLNTSESEDALEAASVSRSAGVYGPTGVRDPGGNIEWLAVNAVVSYGF